MIKHLLLIALLLAPYATHAATLSVVQVSVHPENPKPGSSITVNAIVVGTPTTEVLFRWDIDGESVATGANSSSIVIDAPPIGRSKSIVVTASLNGTALGSATVMLRPSDVTIEWEGQVSTTPFFMGRPLATADSVITAVAVPALIRANGTAVPTKDILFSWKINGAQRKADSGYGASSISFTSPFFDNALSLNVTAISRDGSLSAEDTIAIRPVKPQLAIYEESALGGVESSRAIIDSYPFTSDEVSFVAYPLYVVNPDDLAFQWSLNGEPFTLDTVNPRSAVFKKTGGGHGTYEVKALYTQVKRFLENAQQSFSLTF